MPSVQGTHMEQSTVVCHVSDVTVGFQATLDVLVFGFVLMVLYDFYSTVCVFV